MKTKFFSFLALAIFMATQATAQKITYDPPVPDPDQPLTVTVDLELLTNQTLAGLTPDPDIYLWTWVESVGDSPTNGAWGESNPIQKMTQTTGKKYTFTYGPTLKDFFGKTSEDLWCKQLGCLAKGKDGGGTPEKKSEDMKTKIDCPVTGAQLLSTHPSKWLLDTLLVETNDVITFKYNNNLDTIAFRKNLPPNSMYCYINVTFSDGTQLKHSPYSGAAPRSVDTNPALLMKAVGNNEYHLSFIPEQFFEQADCPNAALFAAKRQAGLRIVKIDMQPYKQRAVPGVGAFSTPFLQLTSFFLPK